jgi:hypothetical protein
MFVAEMLRKTDHAILRIDRIYYAIELFYYLSQHTTLIEVNTAFHRAVKNKIVQLEMEIQDDRCRLAVQQHECQKHESACAMLPSLIQLAKEVALLDHLNHIMKRLKPIIYA